MKNIFKIAAIVSAFLLLVSCEEFQPVFMGKYPAPEDPVIADMQANTSIAELKAMYKGHPINISKDLIIKGQVTTNDQPGNVYKSIYIQDETAGIELKIGKNALYNVYKPGQWIYVNCNGLTLGQYYGMVQLGYKDPSGIYETSYLEAQYIIDNHIFKGAIADQVKPIELKASDLNLNNKKNLENLGRLVTLRGLKYGNGIFCMFYPDPNIGTLQRKEKNKGFRVFLDEKGGNWGVTTWAMSERKFQENLDNGLFDSAKTDSKTEAKTVAELRKLDKIKASANSVSQYFKMENVEVQIRTSGYAKFSDLEIDPDVLSGKKTINITGIFGRYKDDIQFTLIDLDGVQVND